MKKMTNIYLWIAIVTSIISIIFYGIYYINSSKENTDTQNLISGKIDSANAKIDTNKNEILAAINRLKDAKVDSSEQLEKLAGVDIWMFIKIENVDNNRRKYIIDGGDKNKNRFSIYLDNNNNLCFRIIDSNSETQTIKFSNDKFSFLGEYILANFQFGYSKHQSFLRVAINGKTASNNKYDYQILFDASIIKDMFLGCDIDHQNNAVFYLSELVIYNVTTNTIEQQKLLDYFKNKEYKSTVFFNGTSWMTVAKFKFK